MAFLTNTTGCSVRATRHLGPCRGRCELTISKAPPSTSPTNLTLAKNKGRTNRWPLPWPSYIPNRFVNEAGLGSIPVIGLPSARNKNCRKCATPIVPCACTHISGKSVRLGMYCNYFPNGNQTADGRDPRTCQSRTPTFSYYAHLQSV